MSSHLFDLTNKVAVVVGGTSGIGRTLALGLAEAGAHVIVTGRRQELLDEVADLVEERGRRTVRLTSDVHDTASLERLRDACLSEFG
jgi:NAD(P)-dependent dehydrogenase (short-subunit alcohol dehydrogenase family)